MSSLKFQALTGMLDINSSTKSALDLFYHYKIDLIQHLTFILLAAILHLLVYSSSNRVSSCSSGTHRNNCAKSHVNFFLAQRAQSLKQKIQLNRESWHHRPDSMIVGLVKPANPKAVLNFALGISLRSQQDPRTKNKV